MKVAFERLELETGNWTAMGRPERLRHTQWNCRRRDLARSRKAALASFRRCAQHTELPASAHGWSLEYHVTSAVGGDRSINFAQHLRELRAMLPLPETTIIAVAVLREPHSWFASEWRQPEGLTWPARSQQRHHFDRFVKVIGAFQWRALVEGSGWNATDGAVDAASIRRLLSRFDVVGVTERLPTTMFLLCSALRLVLCPTLPQKVSTGRELPPHWPRSVYQSTLNASERALVEDIAAADFLLHAHAAQRLRAAVGSMGRAMHIAWRRYVGAHETQPELPPCETRFRWGKRLRGPVANDARCTREARTSTAGAVNSTTACRESAVAVRPKRRATDLNRASR